MENEGGTALHLASTAGRGNNMMDFQIFTGILSMLEADRDICLIENITQVSSNSITVSSSAILSHFLPEFDLFPEDK